MRESKQKLGKDGQPLATECPGQPNHATGDEMPSFKGGLLGRKTLRQSCQGDDWEWNHANAASSEERQREREKDWGRQRHAQLRHTTADPAMFALLPRVPRVRPLTTKVSMSLLIPM